MVQKEIIEVRRTKLVFLRVHPLMYSSFAEKFLWCEFENLLSKNGDSAKLFSEFHGNSCFVFIWSISCSRFCGAILNSSPTQKNRVVKDCERSLLRFSFLILVQFCRGAKKQCQFSLLCWYRSSERIGSNKRSWCGEFLQLQMWEFTLMHLVEVIQRDMNFRCGWTEVKVFVKLNQYKIWSGSSLCLYVIGFLLNNYLKQLVVQFI